jgi:hypothetical protein
MRETRELNQPHEETRHGGTMNLKRVTIELDVSEVQEILAVDMDNDAQRALSFIKERLAKEVKKRLQRH